MNWRAWPDAAAFLEAAGPHLRAEPLANQLPLGIATALVADPQRYGPAPARLYTVHEGGRCVGAVVQTPPAHPVLSAMSPEAARVAAEHTPEAAGVVGPVPAVTAFVERRAAPELVSELGLFELREVQPVPACAGAPRPATLADAACLQAWALAFHDEAVPHDPPPPPTEGERLARTGNSWLWVLDGEPVAWSHHSRVVEGFGAIGPVYTPPSRRGRGYATALVAAHSAALLGAGRRGCTLYTDLANPTSNAIYERIGYRRVGTMRRYRWAPAG